MLTTQSEARQKERSQGQQTINQIPEEQQINAGGIESKWSFWRIRYVHTPLPEENAKCLNQARLPPPAIPNYPNSSTRTVSHPYPILHRLQEVAETLPHCVLIPAFHYSNPRAASSGSPARVSGVGDMPPHCPIYHTVPRTSYFVLYQPTLINIYSYSRPNILPALSSSSSKLSTLAGSPNPGKHEHFLQKSQYTKPTKSPSHKPHANSQPTNTKFGPSARYA
jgi:hypothetical protein